MFRVNLGGEGEVAGVLNQQGPWVATDPQWKSSRAGKTVAELIVDGHAFLICTNTKVMLPDECVDEVITNSAPIDVVTWLGPGIQSSEITRIIKPGGMWIADGVLQYQKP